MLIALLILPLLAAVAAFVLPSDRWRAYLVPLGGALHFLVLAPLVVGPTVTSSGNWLVFDPLGKLVLSAISVLYLVCSFFVPGYLAHYNHRPNRFFVMAMLGFLSATSLVILAHHLGLMWVAMEATTLITAPLIYFNRNVKSLEATWKYLLICSVGIALALLGSFFLAYASIKNGLPSSLLFEDLVKMAPQLSRPWLHAAFALLLVGYGTKMGLAPMHTWKPDAYGEAPGIVGALLAGGLSNCGFIALLRVLRISQAGGDGAYAHEAMIAMGLVSMVFAAVFMVRQNDIKRMLAYSSVEHMGILVLGVGLGGEAIYGALLHLMNNAATKGVMFLAAANMHRTYGSKQIADIKGVLHRLPVSGALFIAGFFAITGSPPFGPFVSLFTILGQMMKSGRFFVAGLFLALLGVVFIGMGASVLAIVQGRPTALASASPDREKLWSTAPMVVLLAFVLVLGFYIPAPLQHLLEQGTAMLEVTR